MDGEQPQANAEGPPNGEEAPAQSENAQNAGNMDVDSPNPDLLADDMARAALAPLPTDVDEGFESENDEPKEPKDGAMDAAMKKFMQFFAALTPAMAGLSVSSCVPGLTALMGPAPYFHGDGKTSWNSWCKSMVNRFTALQVPKANWVAITLALLAGSALSYATTNGVSETTTWETFVAIMAAGPWSAKETTFSLLFKLTRGNLGTGNAVETVTQIELIRSKLSLLLPFQFWVFVLLLNLAPAFRETLLTNPNGQDWTSYEELRSVVLSKAAAQRSCNSSTRGHNLASNNDKETKTPAKSNKWNNGNAANRLFGNTANNKRSQATPGNADAKRPKSTGPGCFGCGSMEHRVHDIRPDGSHVCPEWDPTKVKKGNNSHNNNSNKNHPKGRGKRA